MYVNCAIYFQVKKLKKSTHPSLLKSFAILHLQVSMVWQNFSNLEKKGLSLKSAPLESVRF